MKLSNTQTKVFLITFIFVSFLLGIRFYLLDMTDSGMWGHQAEYILSGNPQQFDFLGAYGHPGTTIVEGTIILSKFIHLRSDWIVLILVTLLCSLIASLAALICFKLNKEKYWPVGVAITLASSPFFESATPPSVVASLSVVLLSLMTLYLYEHKDKTPEGIIWWGLISGFTVATRTDIGVLSSLIFFLVLLNKSTFKVLLKGFLVSVVTFIVFDPYMWTMPIQHIKDLFHKIFFHYAEFGIYHIETSTIIILSMLASISFLLSIVAFTRFGTILKLIPQKFWIGITTLTLVVYGMFLTSNFQAERYLMPVVLIWEVFLSLYVLKLLDNVSFRNKKLLKICFLIIWFVCYLSFFIQTLYVNHSFNLI